MTSGRIAGPGASKRSWIATATAGVWALVIATCCGTAAEAGRGASREPALQEGSRSEYPGWGSCRVLRECYASADRDVDGCPDFVVTFAPGSAELSPEEHSVLDEVVRETRELPIRELRLVAVLVAGEAPELAPARARAVKVWLERRGVPAPLLGVRTAHGASAVVWFEPSCPSS
jgi:outer membrane protein OmpA-like peptidoglycan-associated protein